MTKQFQAYAKNHGNRVADTPRQAAKDFFAHNPKARKCNVIQGVANGIFFTVTYGRASKGEWPESYKDVTRKTLDTLPDEVAA